MRSGSGGAATSDPLLRSSVVVALLLPWSWLSVRRSCSATASQPLLQPQWIHAPGKVEFVANEKDLESDEPLSANQERDHAEMARRFSRFKQTVLSVDRNQKSQPVCPTDLR